jgi:hypothetical protein
MMLKLGMNNLWSTPVYKGSMTEEDYLPVLNYFLINENAPRDNFEQRDFDILDDGSDILQNFKNKVVHKVFNDYINDLDLDLPKNPLGENIEYWTRSWLAGSKHGYMIPVHNHSGAHFSAVFYFLCTDDNKGGELVLMDPRTNANRGYTSAFKSMFQNEQFLPKSGEFIIFPSFLYHHTNVFTGTTRLAMPVDLFFAD